MVLILGFKKTYYPNTGLKLHFTAKCPKKWKTGSLLCFLNSAKMICSNDLFKREIRYLRNLFIKNEYPGWFFDKSLKKFEERNKLEVHRN